MIFFKILTNCLFSHSIRSNTPRYPSAINLRSEERRAPGAIVSEREIFGLVGPLNLTSVDWKNTYHQRSVTACLVQAVYVLERDRQDSRQGSQALAPAWWEFFHFQLVRTLVDDVDSSIFGAIYELNPSTSYCDHAVQLHGAPRYVIAFRGTITKGDSFSEDLKLDIEVIRNGLHLTSRSELAVQAVRNMVASSGDINIWLTGHSLGSSMALLAGKNMAKTGIYLEAFLFNPPFFSAPIERIKDKKLKHGIRIAGSLITAGLTIAMKRHQHQPRSENPFFALSPWVPYLFVNPEAAVRILNKPMGFTSGGIQIYNWNQSYIITDNVSEFPLPSSAGLVAMFRIWRLNSESFDL
ncbi:hypothetical protein MKW98_025326 [Papaver atlanticum]|uniref:Fungal lipase-type domain-containing protein n=1 Tax=Papaver atlanticum TaxID=357466 RepID=A0AAD4X9Y1_9MAGN|nr:hypothetical protein MKW98_025326 [Papaver atlanticum]